MKNLKDSINKYEWTKELDLFLMDTVIRNYFNFDMVSLEVNEESRKIGLNFGATHAFTNEKCRLRWSYLHMKVNLMLSYSLKETSRKGSQIQNNANEKERRRRGEDSEFECSKTELSIESCS